MYFFKKDWDVIKCEISLGKFFQLIKGTIFFIFLWVHQSFAVVKINENPEYICFKTTLLFISKSYPSIAELGTALTDFKKTIDSLKYPLAIKADIITKTVSLYFSIKADENWSKEQLTAICFNLNQITASLLNFLTDKSKLTFVIYKDLETLNEQNMHFVSFLFRIFHFRDSFESLFHKNLKCLSTLNTVFYLANKYQFTFLTQTWKEILTQVLKFAFPLLPSHEIGLVSHAIHMGQMKSFLSILWPYLGEIRALPNFKNKVLGDFAGAEEDILYCFDKLIHLISLDSLNIDVLVNTLSDIKQRNMVSNYLDDTLINVILSCFLDLSVLEDEEGSLEKQEAISANLGMARLALIDFLTDQVHPFYFYIDPETFEEENFHAATVLLKVFSSKSLFNEAYYQELQRNGLLCLLFCLANEIFCSFEDPMGLDAILFFLRTCFPLLHSNKLNQVFETIKILHFESFLSIIDEYLQFREDVQFLEPQRRAHAIQAAY